MRSLFWRIFASFWLAVALVAGLSLLLGRALNQDAWILNHHPGLDNLAQRWSQQYENQGAEAAQRHGGSLQLSNHPHGGFVACLALPLRPSAQS